MCIWIGGLFGSGGSQYAGWGIPIILVPGLLGLGIWLRIARRWRGFLPGLLIGFFVTCLVPVGIVAVVCGPMSH